MRRWPCYLLQPRPHRPLTTNFSISPIIWSRQAPLPLICWLAARCCRSALRKPILFAQKFWIQILVAGKLEDHLLDTDLDTSWTICSQNWCRSRHHRCLGAFSVARTLPGNVGRRSLRGMLITPPRVQLVGQLVYRRGSFSTYQRRQARIFHASWRVHVEIKWSGRESGRRGPSLPGRPPKN